MELCQLKLYGKIIDLEVGDLFWQNTPNGTIHYQPKSSHNLAKLPRGNNISHRGNCISCQKYANEVRLADNLKKLEGGKPGHYLTEWVVEYVYKQDRVKYDALIVMEISFDKFEVKEVDVERMTEKFIFVEPYHPITFLSRIEKTELLKIQFHYGGMFGICMPDDYSKLESLLFDGYATHTQEKIKQIQKSLVEARGASDQFQSLRIKYGYTPSNPKRTK